MIAGFFKFVFFAAVFAAASVVHATDYPPYFTDDFEGAKTKASKGGKNLLVLFSGTDWCKWCMKFDREVLCDDRFVSNVTNAFECVMIDCPVNESLLPKKTFERNERLCDKYKVELFPTVLIMDARGAELGRTIYRQSPPMEFYSVLTNFTARHEN